MNPFDEGEDESGEFEYLPDPTDLIELARSVADPGTGGPAQVDQRLTPADLENLEGFIKLFPPPWKVGVLPDTSAIMLTDVEGNPVPLRIENQHSMLALALVLAVNNFRAFAEIGKRWAAWKAGLGSQWEDGMAEVQEAYVGVYHVTGKLPRSRGVEDAIRAFIAQHPKYADALSAALERSGAHGEAARSRDFEIQVFTEVEELLRGKQEQDPQLPKEREEPQ